MPGYTTRKLFSAEILKMAECHFWSDVMLRQSHVRASRASPAQKLQGLRVVCSKTFSGLHFLFSGYLSCWTAFWVICPWNEFEEKEQCATVFYNFLLLPLLLILHSSTWLLLFKSETWLAKVHLQSNDFMFKL